MSKYKSNSEELALCVVNAIQEKKGENIKLLDLRSLDNATSDFFIICEAQSDPQMNAIFENIEENVKKQMNDDLFQVEGRQASIWILMDYVDVVVHIFKPEAREFYRLEALWADAKIKSF